MSKYDFACHKCNGFGKTNDNLMNFVSCDSFSLDFKTMDFCHEPGRSNARCGRGSGSDDGLMFRSDVGRFGTRRLPQVDELAEVEAELVSRKSY